MIELGSLVNRSGLGAYPEFAAANGMTGPRGRRPGRLSAYVTARRYT
jgi:hypothetical protein